MAELTVYTYRGGSMLGTFRPGDRISFEPVSLANVQPGDVVAVRPASSAGAARELVHRVVGLRPDGLVTRGDNNPGNDPTLVTADTLLGRVTRLERAGKLYPVRGGRWGLWRARLLHTRRAARHFLGRLGGGLYRRLCDSGRVARWWHPAVMQLHFTTRDGPLVKYLLRGRTVATWWPQERRFECPFPYGLIIHPPALAADPTPCGQQSSAAVEADHD